MAWYDFTPSWERIDRNRVTSDTEAREASLIPLKAQQMQLDAKESALRIAHEGIRQQAEDSKLNFELRTMPDRVNQIHQETQLNELNLNERRVESSAFQRDLGKWNERNSHPWEERQHLPLPQMESKAGVKMTMDQERLDSTSASQKALRERSVSDLKEKTRMVKEQTDFNNKRSTSGLTADQLSEVEKTMIQSSVGPMPTMKSYDMISQLKAEKTSKTEGEKKVAVEQKRISEERFKLETAIVNAQAELDGATDEQKKIKWATKITKYRRLLRELGPSDSLSGQRNATPSVVSTSTVNIPTYDPNTREWSTNAATH